MHLIVPEERPSRRLYRSKSRSKLVNPRLRPPHQPPTHPSTPSTFRGLCDNEVGPRWAASSETTHRHHRFCRRHVLPAPARPPLRSQLASRHQSREQQSTRCSLQQYLWQRASGWTQPDHDREQPPPSARSKQYHVGASAAVHAASTTGQARAAAQRLPATSGIFRWQREWTAALWHEWTGCAATTSASAKPPAAHPPRSGSIRSAATTGSARSPSPGPALVHWTAWSTRPRAQHRLVSHTVARISAEAYVPATGW